ncbi:MAG: ester cyclase [Thermomicrobiales bacterium]
MATEANKAIVRRYFEELWNHGDLAFIDECMGPDVVHPWGHATQALWREAVAAWRTAFPDFRYHVDELIAEGDTVAANTRFTATHQGVYHLGKTGPWPPTGKAIEFREMIFFHLADGKIVGHWEVWDATAFDRQLGRDKPQATTTT